jgi:hypothetical protein
VPVQSHGRNANCASYPAHGHALDSVFIEEAAGRAGNFLCRRCWHVYTVYQKSLRCIQSRVAASALGLYPRHNRRVPHTPDFLCSFGGSLNFMRPSSKKGAHAVLSRAAYRKFGASRSFFARCGIPQGHPSNLLRVPNVRLFDPIPRHQPTGPRTVRFPRQRTYRNRVARERFEGKTCGANISRKTSEMPRISCVGSSGQSRVCAFLKERRRKSGNPRNYTGNRGCGAPPGYW